MILLNEKNFYIKTQEIIEQYYLAPMDRSKKSNLRNGHIERTVHGAMHACRVTLWALVMHQFLQKIASNYVHASLDKIAAHVHSNANTVLLLILITATCHDSARRGEGGDVWEAESADNTRHFLISLGLEETHARLFANAIQWKDNIAQYNKELIKFGIAAQDCNAFDYIRKLINLGDTLDIMRCMQPFDTKYVFKTMQSINGFDLNVHHDDVLLIIQSIHQIIYDQSDMLWGCHVNDANQIVSRHNTNFSLTKKLKYEHADNSFLSILQDILIYPAISSLLQEQMMPFRRSVLTEEIQNDELNQQEASNFRP